MFGFRNRFILGCGFLGSLLCSASVFGASRFYLETAGGLSWIQNANLYFNDEGAHSLSQGFASQITFAYSLSHPKRAVQAHLGIQHRLSSGSGGNSVFGMQSTYPILRVEFAQFFVGIGATPFLLRNSSNQLSFLGYKRVQDAIGFLGEVGYHYEITPEISIGATLSAQTVSIETRLSPLPSLEAMGLFRFYFGETSTTQSQNRPRPEGWRYPFGIGRH